MTAWAKQLRKAGLDGDMDQLRARAFMDILLGTDSRPLAGRPDGTHRQDGTGGTGRGGAGGTGPAGCGPDGTRHDRGDGPDGSGPGEPRTPAPAGPLAGVIPPGFAGRVTLTIPAATVLGLADRPGEMAGIGPIDPNPGANTSDRYRTLTRLPAYLDRGRRVRDCQMPTPASGSR